MREASWRTFAVFLVSCSRTKPRSCICQARFSNWSHQHAAKGRLLFSESEDVRVAGPSCQAHLAVPVRLQLHREQKRMSPTRASLCSLFHNEPLTIRPSPASHDELTKSSLRQHRRCPEKLTSAMRADALLGLTPGVPPPPPRASICCCSSAARASAAATCSFNPVHTVQPGLNCSCNFPRKRAYPNNRRAACTAICMHSTSSALGQPATCCLRLHAQHQQCIGTTCNRSPATACMALRRSSSRACCAARSAACASSSSLCAAAAALSLVLPAPGLPAAAGALHCGVGAMAID